MASANPETIIWRDVKNLKFDPENPRLPRKLRGEHVKENDVLDWMLENENLLELMGSIAEKGFFPAEPLLIVKKGANDYEVVEGNRRLSAIKLLNNPKGTSKRQAAIEELINSARKGSITKEIPTLLFPNKADLQLFLGYRHITGIKEWDALAKARYARKLLEVLGLKPNQNSYQRLARMIGSTSGFVKTILRGLDVYEVIEENNYFNIDDLDDTTMQFGVLYTAVSRPNVAVFVGINMDDESPIKKGYNPKNLKELTEWLFRRNDEGVTRVGDSRNLKLLNSILDKKAPAALKAFRDGVSITAAAVLTDEPKKAFLKSMLKAKDNLLIAQNQIHNIKPITKSELKQSEELRELAKGIYSLVNSKLNDEE